MVVGIQLVVLGEVPDAFVDVAESAKLLVVARQHYLILAFGSEESVVGIGLERCPVEYKHEVAALECEHLIIVLVPQLLDRQNDMATIRLTSSIMALSNAFNSP